MQLPRHVAPVMQVVLPVKIDLAAD